MPRGWGGGGGGLDQGEEGNRWEGGLFSVGGGLVREKEKGGIVD